MHRAAALSALLGAGVTFALVRAIRLASAARSFGASDGPSGGEPLLLPPPMKPTEDAVVVRVANPTGFAFDIFYLDESSEPSRALPYGSIQPGAHWENESYPDHLWLARATGGVQCATRFRIDGTIARQLVVLTGASFADVRPILDMERSSATLGRAYVTRLHSRLAPGLEVCALAGVARRSVELACEVVDCMLAGCAPELLQSFSTGVADQRIALIGPGQVTTDIPEHGHLRGRLTGDGRDFDAGTRGLGGTRAIPTTSVGEENVTRCGDTRYPRESILVHEFAHHIMNINVSASVRAAIADAYEAARRDGLYGDQACYAMSNYEEYWAEGVQAWFDASVRVDVNGGINTRELLCQRDPRLAAIMQAVFGVNNWRYPQTMPGTWPL